MANELKPAIANGDANIYRRLAAITAELQTVAKNLDVQTGGGKSYRAVSERDIIDAVKPLEAKYGVYSYPIDRVTEASEILESESTYGDKTTKKTTFYSRIRTTYRFVNVDDPLDYIDTVVFSVGLDSQDKGDGKAMTYGDKYALMKAYKISTGDDPDAEASKDTSYTIAGKPVSMTCADCGRDISDRVHDFSLRKYKRPLCRDCQAEADRAG